jgi:hypothetical protein
MTLNVTDDMMDAALQILASPAHAEAKAWFEKLDRQRKVMLARLEREANDTSVRGRETYALTHPHYAALLEQIDLAESTYLVARDRRDSAEAVTRAWQTGKADARAAERVR